MNIILETQRLFLRPISSGQIDTLYSILTDPYVRKYMCDDRIFPLPQVEEMLIQSLKMFQEEKFGLWFIETKRTTEIIGFVGLWYFFDEAQPQLVYALLPQATKKGYAAEASKKILEYSFNELGYDYLIASCDKPNIESCKVALRLEMEQVEERMVNGNPLLFFKIDKINNYH